MRGDAEDTNTPLRDVIKAVRGCKTSAEEHSIISSESARIRTSFRNEYNENRHRNVAKLIFFHMLGYNADFGHMEVLKLIVSKKFGDKKVGYLALTQIMGEESALTLMAISSIKADLASDKPNVVQTALSAIANTASVDMCRELATDVLALLTKSRSSVMPRAALAACRILRKCPELVDDFTPLATSFVDEHNTQLLGTGLSLIITILRTDPSKCTHFATFSASLQTSLRELVMKDSNEELNINNITCPFTQCRLLEVLRLTGKFLKQDRADLEETLAYVLTSTEFAKQTGRSVIYECCKTILDIDASKKLREQAISMLGKLLMSRENNTRFIALKGLSKEVCVDPVTIQSFRSSILDCVQDLDAAVARRALELVVQLATPANIRQITSDLLTLLVTAEADMKETIARKVCMLAEMHAADQRGYVDTMVRVLSLAGTCIDDDTISRTANIILECPQLHEYAVKMLFFSARDNLAQDGLVLLALWCFGEYGNLLVFGEEMVGLPTPSGGEVLEMVKGVLDRDTPVSVKMYALTALVKASTRLPSELPTIRALLEPVTLSPSLELQQRACEYMAILDDQFFPLWPHLFQPSPPFEKEKRPALTAAPVIALGASFEPDLMQQPTTLVDEFTEEPEIIVQPRRGNPWESDLLSVGEQGPQTTTELGSEHPPDLFPDIFSSGPPPHLPDLSFPQPTTAIPSLIPEATDLLSIPFPPSAASDLGGVVFASPMELPLSSEDFSEVPSLDFEVYADSELKVAFSWSKFDLEGLDESQVVVVVTFLTENITELKLTPSGDESLQFKLVSTQGGVGDTCKEYKEVWKVTNTDQKDAKIRVQLGLEYCKEGEWVKKEVRVDESGAPF